MNLKTEQRHRRAKKTRIRIKEQGITRLAVYRSSKNMYAQLIDSKTGHVLCGTSTLDAGLKKDLKAEKKSTSNIEAAKKVGLAIARKAKEMGIESVAFDRSGFLYHGRVKALAEAAREGGLQF